MKADGTDGLNGFCGGLRLQVLGTQNFRVEGFWMQGFASRVDERDLGLSFKAFGLCDVEVQGLPACPVSESPAQSIVNYMQPRSPSLNMYTTLKGLKPINTSYYNKQEPYRLQNPKPSKPYEAKTLFNVAFRGSMSLNPLNPEFLCKPWVDPVCRRF